MQKISTCLWFDSDAEEAANYYVSVFKNSKLGAIALYTEGNASVSGKPAGSVMSIEFSIDGRDFMGLNGGPVFKISEAVSFIIGCENQAEVDYFYDKLADNGGQIQPCGWVKDKFGVSWQLTPKNVSEMMADPDPEKSKRVWKVMLSQERLNIDVLQAAYGGK